MKVTIFLSIVIFIIVITLTTINEVYHVLLYRAWRPMYRAGVFTNWGLCKGGAAMVVAEVAVERRLPRAADKEELMVLRGGCKRKKRGRNGLTENVKWLGVILDDRLDLNEHWRHRIGKARSLLGALGVVGNSKWGMSQVSWRAAYTGMVCAVVSWGVEIGWPGQGGGHMRLLCCRM